MPTSIFHIGLPLDHPSIPADDRPNVTKRLASLQQTMTALGYDYQIIHASPETGLDAFRQLLRTHPCDGVLIGGGVASDPSMTYFMEQIIDAAHTEAPHAKIIVHTHSLDVPSTVARWLPPPAL
jgi:hypothetical protein